MDTLGTIWKKQAPVNGEIELELPKGSEMLSVGKQGVDELMLTFWFIADPGEEETETISLKVYGTGHPILPGALAGYELLGTVIADPFVWHVFLKGTR